MSTASQLASAAMGMAGIIQKAYITICDDSDISSDIKVDAGVSTSSLFNISVVNNALNAVENVLSDLLGTSENTFTVQFNPSSLHLVGIGGGLIPKLNFAAGTGSNNNSGNEARQACFGEAPVRINLEMALIFDNVYPANAFKADKLNASYSSVLTGALALTEELTGMSEYSVQPDVEAFIGALQNNKTRKLIFTWGKLQYKGFLNRVRARYTMFNSSAEPIRAEVYLSIICADEAIDKDDYGQWDKSYKEAFENGSKSYVTTSQYASSLLNFSV